VAGLTGEIARAAFARRTEPGQALAGDAEGIARACHEMAVRFSRGGRLVSFGNGPAAADAAHLAVEFVHPVIVGKRALPAVALGNDVTTLTEIARIDGFDETYAVALARLAGPTDIAVGITPDGNCGNVLRGLQAARPLGLLTVALTGGDGGRIAAEAAADHLLTARTDDPRIVKEVHVTLYHVLWELVHVFFDQPGLLATAR
jgi:D-sedoheptulose 7-phosphate isomerase